MSPPENVSSFYCHGCLTNDRCLFPAQASSTHLTHMLPVLHCCSVIWNVTSNWTPPLKKASPKAHLPKCNEDRLSFQGIKTWRVHPQTNNQNKSTWRYQAESSHDNWSFFPLWNICQQAGLLSKVSFLDRMIPAFEKMYSVNKTE